MTGNNGNSFEANLVEALRFTDDFSKPNVNKLQEILRNIPSVCFNIKFYGYDLARRLSAALPVREGLTPASVGLSSKASTQADMESDWVAYWCQELKIPVVFHRKVWELAYAAQAVYETGNLTPGKTAIGFGCGEEALPSYFASKGVKVVVTDLAPEDARARGWVDTNQHTKALDSAYHPHLIEMSKFKELVSLEYVDMNDIPQHLGGFDFCWSICALEHLGSIERGLRFIERSLDVLRPGGVAIHTTEYNFTQSEATIDNWDTVLFLRKHFVEIYENLTSKGHRVRPLDLSVGNLPMDRFIDVPPFAHDYPSFLGDWIGEGPHLKLCVDGYPSTCFGFIIEKAL